ncbi:MAG: glutamate mutase L [bacterium]|nr:glutamate mutase L [bacterium]
MNNLQDTQNQLRRIVVTDCGSTTTKALLFEKKHNKWQMAARGEAPTTVEEPVADVTLGALNAFRELEELSGLRLLKGQPTESNSPFIFPAGEEQGIDLYLSTSSAGGGLQMIVAGVIGSMTTQSAQRAALGAGAIVMDSLSLDDERETFELVSKVRHLKPDIILISGGTDGGTTEHPLELCEIILQANPQPRFGATLKTPVIYAGNKLARESAKKILSGSFSFTSVANLRPTLEKENLTEAREAIHELFLQHVMSHAPGYGKLLSWSPHPVIPTPAGVGNMVMRAAKKRRENVLAVDIGGATTDVFSALHEQDGGAIRFNRTVSANLGMSYSVANVLLEAGIDNILRWLTFPVSLPDTENQIRNKMIRPTTIPQRIEDLLLEHAIAREALRLSLIHHKTLATDLKGRKKTGAVTDIFRRTSDEEDPLKKLDLIIGSGGVLSHAPKRQQAARMLLDAFTPHGVCLLAVDSVFMMPHLGVLAEHHADAADEIFDHNCLVPLGTSISATGRYRHNQEAGVLEHSGKKHPLLWGQLVHIELASEKELLLTITPSQHSTDFGAGPGETLSINALGGEAGVYIDLRGRPIFFPTDKKERQILVNSWDSVNQSSAAAFTGKEPETKGFPE